MAGEQDIVRDHDLVKRTHSQGILFPDTWWDGQGMPAMYFYEGEVKGEPVGQSRHDDEHGPPPGRGDRVAVGAVDPAEVSRGAR